jgi:hypothetical protein
VIGLNDSDSLSTSPGTGCRRQTTRHPRPGNEDAQILRPNTAIAGMAPERGSEPFCRAWRTDTYRAGLMIVDNFYFVSIDSVRVGEIWPRQSKVFEVTPGNHGVRVRREFTFPCSRTVRVSVEDGQIVELACWPSDQRMGGMVASAIQGVGDEHRQ